MVLFLGANRRSLLLFLQLRGLNFVQTLIKILLLLPKHDDTPRAIFDLRALPPFRPRVFYSANHAVWYASAIEKQRVAASHSKFSHFAASLTQALAPRRGLANVQFAVIAQGNCHGEENAIAVDVVLKGGVCAVTIADHLSWANRLCTTCKGPKSLVRRLFAAVHV
mmetsp:Transcript_30152/g.59036  ORF Transcript_30152/g.59036 Transcript_30152/m.59036 type:complete len:166 (+) Transcript_30152:32-529(+)